MNNTIPYTYSPFETSVSPDIRAGLLLNTSNIWNIDFQKDIEYIFPYYIYHYFQKIKLAKVQEAHMNYVTQIRNLREDSDKTQQQIADILGTSQTMYARYERGANEMPIRHLIKLAQYYNVSLDYLCGLSMVKRPYPMI